MNNNCIVIYQSKTDFTKRYAQWISEALSCDAVSYEERKSISPAAYDTVIFGGGFHAGKINGIKWFKQILPELSAKTVIVFGTGATPAESPETKKAMRQNFTESEWNKIKTFYFQSGICYEKMSFGERTLMSMFRKMLQKSEPDSEMCKMIQSSFDSSSREAIAPLIKCVM